MSRRKDDRWELLSRRRMLATSLGALGYSLPAFLALKQRTAAADSNADTNPADSEAASANAADSNTASPNASRNSAFGTARSCIVLYCWGGMSHHETFDPKPHAPAEIRGEFRPIRTTVPGIFVGEHIPRLAAQLDKLAVIRSIHHESPAHGKGMYWNLTGHAPPERGTATNLPPSRKDWPSLSAMVGKFRTAPRGLPRSVRLPYPLVDNQTLQAGEYGGWLGLGSDPIAMRTPAGREFGGVSQDLGAAVLNLSEDLDAQRLGARRQLLASLERPIGVPGDFANFEHFRQLAGDMLLAPTAREACDLEREDARVRESYGDHICGQSLLLARRLTEAGVPIVTVCCAAGDLNGSVGDHWDTHSQNFARLKNRMLPVFDRAATALLADLDQRGQLDETLVVMLTDFGRTPTINAEAGRDHYPNVYSVFLAGGGVRGGQVYGSSDAHGAFPADNPCTPADVHATIFQALGISPRAEIHDRLGRPFSVSDGRVLPLT
ncbi:MAG: DUF1501 domain-containing protein [Planctomycetota bacterium]|nr:MAG: DUF1501 domain-containing protein [Planctomycetota bacterium]REJ87877.1 MAG: DUF1501 domain-containing protein [Planctomycetota bacterium]REK26454.1 MAG: DUF1501 domain-containing protein [Planctomycetota bacterium]REK38709.1 MAG: DUF1501 domain-containing protein [Planctomycetota bacterium]